MQQNKYENIFCKMMAILWVSVCRKKNIINFSGDYVHMI